MRRALVTAFAVIITGASCAEDKASLFTTGTPAPSTAAAPGSIAMRLVGTDAQGRPYWLRSATFTIAPTAPRGGDVDAGGQGAFTVSSEDDPDVELLSVTLDAGSYEVTLQPGWYLEYQTAGGSVVRAQNVRLSSPATQSVSIAADQAAELIFRFTVDDSGRGQLDIGVEIDTLSDAGADAGLTPDAGVVEVDGGLDASLGGEGDAGDVEVDAGALDADLGEADADLADAGEADADLADASEADADVDQDAGALPDDDALDDDGGALPPVDVLSLP